MSFSTPLLYRLASISLQGQSESRRDPEAGPKGILMLDASHSDVWADFKSLDEGGFMVPSEFRYTQIWDQKPVNLRNGMANTKLPCYM